LRLDYAAPNVTKVLGPIQPADLMPGRELKDERTLLLTQAPAFALRQEHGAEVRYALVLGQALGRRALMDLMFTIAPYKAHGPDRFARVLDNWGLFDRAKTSSASENLLQQHAASLKSSWQEFARHRDLFVAISADQSESKRVVPLLSWAKNGSNGTRRWRFDDLVAADVRALAEEVPVLREQKGVELTLNPLVGLLTIPYLLPELGRSWRAWQPLVKDGKSNYIGPASMPVIVLRHQRTLLNSALIRRAEEMIDAARESALD
jgi:hypothetical protein